MLCISRRLCFGLLKTELCQLGLCLLIVHHFYHGLHVIVVEMIREATRELVVLDFLGTEPTVHLVSEKLPFAVFLQSSVNPSLTCP